MMKRAGKYYARVNYTYPETFAGFTHYPLDAIETNSVRSACERPNSSRTRAIPSRAPSRVRERKECSGRIQSSAKDCLCFVSFQNKINAKLYITHLFIIRYSLKNFIQIKNCLDEKCFAN